MEERDGRGKGEVSPAVSDSSEGIVNRGSSERQKARENERCDSRAGRETHSLRMCSSMHLAQKRCRHGDTTFTFFIVPQHTAHRVSWRTGPSFIVAARRDVQWPMRSGRREDARAGATTETCVLRVEEAVCVAIDWKFQRRRRSVGTDDSLSNVCLSRLCIVCQASITIETITTNARS